MKKITWAFSSDELDALKRKGKKYPYSTRKRSLCQKSSTQNILKEGAKSPANGIWLLKTSNKIIAVYARNAWNISPRTPYWPSGWYGTTRVYMPCDMDFSMHYSLCIKLRVGYFTYSLTARYLKYPKISNEYWLNNLKNYTRVNEWRH
jgi:hypothetical protein